MNLTVLGSSGAFPAAGGAASGYLVRHDGFNLWIDAGTGTLANIQEHVAHQDVDAMLISHEHPDHCVDLYPLFIARLFHPEPLSPLPLYAPRGVFERVSRLERDEEAGRMDETYEVHEVEPGQAFEVGPFRVSTLLLPHWVPNLGMRLQADGVAFAYTGDTGPDDGVEEIGRGADLLIAEASWQERPGAVEAYHLTARQAGEYAAKAEARKLMLTHFWPGSDREASRSQAQEAFGGDLLLASENLSVELE